MHSQCLGQEVNMAGKRKSLQVFTVQEAQNASLGQAGCILIDDTAAHTGPFVAITALSDAAVDVSQCDMSFLEDAADFTIPKGVTIFGRWTSVNIGTPGMLIAYIGD